LIGERGIQMRARSAWRVAGCAAASSVVLIGGGLALAYVDRHLVPASQTGWTAANISGQVFLLFPAGTCTPGAAGHRYDADQMVAVFAARLKDATDLDAVQSDLTSVIQRALEPARVSMWTEDRG